MPPRHSPPRGNYPLLSCGQLELQKSFAGKPNLWRHSPSCFPFRWNCPRFELNSSVCLVGGCHTTPHQVVKGMLCGLIVSKSKFLFSSRAHLQFHTATISREHQHQVCVGIPLLSPSRFPMSHSSAEKKSVWAGRVCLLMGGTSERK